MSRVWFERVVLGREYAFEERGLDRLFAWMVAINAASMAVLDRLGFRLEGQLREHGCIHGSRRDTCIFGLLAGEWGGGEMKERIVGHLDR